MQELVFSTDEMPAGDWRRGLYVGRIETSAGPSPVVIRDGILHDMARVAPTTADLIRLRAWSDEGGQVLGPLEEIVTGQPGAPALLSPLDLQCVKAAGVTFAVSAIERVIEERARGDANAAAAVRGRLEARIGGSIRSVMPGSDEAAALKATLIEEGMWSQYLEVAIGPDAEVFTKAPILSTMGWGAEIGVRSDSSWNNPEPEIVIVADRDGVPVGATLGNDVNLRDFEGRSALLLGKAKDNNASCSIGPFVRIFDDSFTMDDVRGARVDLSIEGVDGYRLTGASSMAEISRDPTDLVAQTMSEHQYPDGFALFLGTLFAPIEDRDEPGRGFTHKMGDVVSISTPHLGRLVNRVTSSKAAAPWAFGVGDLMRNLAGRQLLSPTGGR
jgi:fumarylacetoacetate (FAA) hydrolase family protein